MSSKCFDKLKMIMSSKHEPVEDFSRYIFIKVFLSFFFLIFISFKSVAITYPNTILVGDSIEKIQKKAANKIANRASLYSAILPGAGQAYNKKIWKIPIIYAGLAVFGVFIEKNYKNVQECHKELVYRYSSASTLNTYSNEKFKYNSVTDVNTIKLESKKYLDFFIIGASIVYLLNVIDANVDGHFRTFDINDDLSLKIKPKASYCIQNPQHPVNLGVSFCFTFK